MSQTLEAPSVDPAAPETESKAVRIMSVMSAPRFGPTDCYYSIARCLIQYGIDFAKVGGANWGQALERGMDEAVEKGADWILTWDYDTVIEPWQFERLINLLGTHPEFDAIAPLEVRRECDDILASFSGYESMADLAKAMAQQDVVDARTAHFGCTLIRVEALKRMPKPWLHHKPAPNGGWGPGRMDDDIGFWHKLKASGGRLGIASKVCIGHCQLMVTWPLDDGTIVFQHMTNYHEQGPPKNVMGGLP